jgi:peptidoglycan hydrolase-like protein with peptidoglycan-binding domain
MEIFMNRFVPLLAAVLLSACAAPMQSHYVPPPAAEVSDAQQRLRGLGYYNGPIDGIWGPETQAAVERYQRNRGMMATARLDNSTATALRAEPIQMPTTAEIRDVQQRMRALGHYNGPIDGQWTAETQAAIERYQRARGMPATARLDAPTVAAIRNDERNAEEARRRAELARPITVSDATDVRTIQNRMRQLNLYDGPADGVWNQRTQASLEGFQRAKGLPVGQLNRQTLAAMDLDPNSFGAQSGSRTASAALMSRPLDPTVVRRIQQRLRADGFYAGAPDGRWGPRTQAGLERFQQSRGIAPSGRLDPMTASALGFDPNNLSAP